MGFLASLFNKSPQRFVTEEGYRTNLSKQKAMTPQTLAQLRSHGVAESAHLKLEYFFYTNDRVKGERLATELRKLGYEAQSGPSAGGKKLELVTGWTTPIQLSEQTAVAWADQMCRLGYECDAEFDGWGTPVP